MQTHSYSVEDVKQRQYHEQIMVRIHFATLHIKAAEDQKALV